MPTFTQQHNFFAGLMVESSAWPGLLSVGTDLRRRYRLGGTPRPRELLHMTLSGFKAVGGPDEDVDRRIETYRAACGRIRFPSFDVCLDQVTSFHVGGGKYATVAVGGTGVHPAMALHDELRCLVEPGRAARPGFTPHVTLRYDRQDIGRQAIEPISWTVREIVLVHSFVGRSRYEFIDRWPAYDA